MYGIERYSLVPDCNGMYCDRIGCYSCDNDIKRIGLDLSELNSSSSETYENKPRGVDNRNSMSYEFDLSFLDGNRGILARTFTQNSKLFHYKQGKKLANTLIDMGVVDLDVNEFSRKECLYPNSKMNDMSENDLVYLVKGLLNSKDEKLALYILTNPGNIKRDASDETQLTDVSEISKKLRDVRFIREERRAPAVHMYPTEALEFIYSSGYSF